MITYMLKKIVLMAPVLLFISIVSFSLIYIAPGDPAEIILTSSSGGADPAAVEEFRIKEGFDKPLYVQYLNWLGAVLRGELGYSYMSERPVSEAILQAFTATFKLAFASFLVSLAISIPAGILAALKHDTWIDDLSRFLALLGVSMPNFWQGYLMILVFSVFLRILPAGGFGENGDFSHLILPMLTLGTSSAAVTMRLMRASLLEVLQEDYIYASRAKGLSEKVVIGKHALKNSIIPVLTMAGLNFGYLLNGSAVVETVFAWPGLGNLIVSSIYNRDYPMIQGTLLFVAVLFVAINLLVDLSYSCLDPRIRDEMRN
ncbi:Oligopeptide transport system permease protein OppB [Methanosarcina sp. MTP4]|uniref:nickel ABC transporter permease n=1 Tax=Methanosarcina sp. MTP4 TaxID=1434100 RepID=UPI0006156ACB|nr:nickel ABC transporter permease [Methanosarcina sp. MTP4]AKB23819.1 Oligopeptide transport system permease protein OppB [Methanosarcina sp. MTP4]